MSTTIIHMYIFLEKSQNQKLNVTLLGVSKVECRCPNTTDFFLLMRQAFPLFYFVHQYLYNLLYTKNKLVIIFLYFSDEYICN